MLTARFLVAPRRAIEYRHAAPASSPPAAPSRAMLHDTSTGGFGRRLLPLLAGVITASLAVFFSAPTLGPLDAGDFVAALATVGVPHPTGFPSWLASSSPILAFPVGSLAARAAWMSALAAGLTAWALTTLVARYVHGPSARNGATLLVTAAFAMVGPVALQARMPEVYLLHTALLATGLLLVDAAARTRSLAYAGPVGLLAGLLAANHASGRIAAFLLIVTLVWVLAHGNRRRVLGLTLIGGTLGSLLWAWLPLAALRDPHHAWGDPSTLARFIEVVQASAIREAFGTEMFRGSAWTLHALQTLVASLAPAWGALTWLVPVGLVLLWRTRAPALRALLLLAALDVAWAVAINPMGLRDMQNAQVAALTCALGIGVTAGAIVDRIRAQNAVVATLASAMVVSLVALPLLDEERVRPEVIHHDTFADDLVAIVGGTTLPGAVVAPLSDTPSAALLYGATVLDARPDALWIGRWELSDRVQLAHRCRHAAPCPLDAVSLASLPRREVLGPAVEGLLANASAAEVPVHFEVALGARDLPSRYGLMEQWPWGFVASRNGEPLCGDAPLGWCDDTADARFAAAARAPSHGSVWVRRFLASRMGQRAATRLQAGDAADAARLFARAAALSDRPGPWLAGEALALARQCRLQASLERTDAALAADPTLAHALRNGRLVALAAGDPARAWHYDVLDARYRLGATVAEADVEAVREACGIPRP